MDSKNVTGNWLPPYDRRKKPVPIYAVDDIEGGMFFWLKTLMGFVWFIIGAFFMIEVLL